MAVIAIANQKGGSGKTTTAVTLAATLAERQHQVLLVDLDPQASATDWLGVPRDEENALGKVLIEGDEAAGGDPPRASRAKKPDLADLIRPSAVEGLSVIASSRHLNMTDTKLASEAGGALALSERLEGVRDRWEYILLDCPPHLSLLTLSALAAADGLLVPVEASAMALGGLGELMRTFQVVKRRLNKDLRLLGIFACRVDPRTRIGREIVEALAENYPDVAMKTAIRERVTLREAWGHRQPLTLYDPESAALEDYRQLANELERRLQ